MAQQSQEPIRVEVEGMGIVEFPAGTSEGQIQSALLTARPQMQKGVKSERLSWLDMTVDALPMVGGIAGGMVGAAGGPLVAAGTAALGGAAGRLAQRAIEGQGADAADVATQGALQGGAQLLGGAVTKAAGAGARAVYRGYLKPSLSKQMAPRAQQIVDTALEEGLAISRGGAQTGQRVIGELRGEVTRILATTRGTVDVKQIGDKVRDFARRRYYRPGADLSDYNAALAVANKIDAHPSLGIPVGVRPTAVRVNPSQANEIKQALDVSATDAAFGVKTGAQKSAEKFGRREMRTQLERVAPRIGPLNARESRLIDATRAIAQAVEREANQYPLIGMKSMIAGGMAGTGMAAGQDPALAAAFGLALRAGLHPTAASWSALVAKRAAKSLGVSTATAARLAVYAVSQNADEQR